MDDYGDRVDAHDGGARHHGDRILVRVGVSLVSHALRPDKPATAAVPAARAALPTAAAIPASIAAARIIALTAAATVSALTAAATLTARGYGPPLPILLGAGLGALSLVGGVVVAVTKKPSDGTSGGGSGGGGGGGGGGGERCPRTGEILKPDKPPIVGADGTKKLVAEVLVPTFITIEARNKEGDRRRVGGDNFVVSIRGFSQVEDNTTDNGDGTYNVAFTVPGPSGVYKVAVMEDGVPLKGSPFKLKVTREQPCDGAAGGGYEAKEEEGGKKAAAKKAAKKEAKAAAVASSPSPAAKKRATLRRRRRMTRRGRPRRRAMRRRVELGSEKKKSMLQKGVEKGKAIAGMMSSKKK